MQHTERRAINPTASTPDQRLCTDGGTTVAGYLRDLRFDSGCADTALRFHESRVTGDDWIQDVIETLKIGSDGLGLAVEHRCGTEYIRHVDGEWCFRLVHEDRGTRPVMELDKETVANRLRGPKSCDLVRVASLPVDLGDIALARTSRSLQREDADA